MGCGVTMLSISCAGGTVGAHALVQHGRLAVQRGRGELEHDEQGRVCGGERWVAPARSSRVDVEQVVVVISGVRPHTPAT